MSTSSKVVVLCSFVLLISAIKTIDVKNDSNSKTPADDDITFGDSDQDQLNARSLINKEDILFGYPSLGSLNGQDIRGKHHIGGCNDCRALVSCSPFYRTWDYNLVPCVLPNGGNGVCCPEVTPETVSVRSLPFPPFPLPPLRVPISKEDIDAVKLDARRSVQKMIEAEALVNSQADNRLGTLPESFKFTPMVGKSIAVAYQAKEFLAATMLLRQRKNLTLEDAAYGLRRVSARGTTFEGMCTPQPLCDKEAKYRSIDGTCNNLKRPTMGQTDVAFQRILPPRYADGVYQPRRSVDGSPLPSARLVRTSLGPNVSRLRSDLTTLFNTYGLIVTTDTQHILMPLRFNSFFGISCCSPDGSTPVPQHPSCLPIQAPPNDPFFSKYNIRCISFLRAEPGLKGNCKNFGCPEPTSLNTHWLDSSGLYGSEKKVADGLRAGIGGLLRSQKSEGQPELLPQDDKTDLTFTCEKCFSSGDNRVNYVPSGTSLVTVIFREHNRIVQQLAKLNPHWTDENLYQEGRRIIGAAGQHITYNEWLPPLLGATYMKKKGLLPLSRGFLPPDHYHPDIDATITVVFGAAAFRLHSLTANNVKFIDKRYDLTENALLRNLLFNPDRLHLPGMIDGALRGMTNQSTEDYDHFFSTEISNIYKKFGPVQVGQDVPAANIQRGRDLGIRGYNEWRPICGLKRVKTFQEFTDVISEQDVLKWSSLYKHPDDVDLFIALVSERHVPGALVGPTAQCLIGDVFQRLKIGDRYWYERGGFPHSFTEAQLHEIRKASLAGLLCDNSGDIGYIQRLPMWKANNMSNPLVDCKGPDIPRMNLEAWRNEPVPSTPKIPQTPIDKYIDETPYYDQNKHFEGRISDSTSIMEKNPELQGSSKSANYK